MAWTESDIAPTEIIATKWLNDTPALGVVRQRPLCPFPSVAQYQGSGDVNEAGSWECAELPFKLPIGGNETATMEATATVTVSVTATVTQVQTVTAAVGSASWSWPWQWQSQGGRPTGTGGW